MITAKLINSEASLNSFFQLSSVNYSPNENLTVAFRLYNEQTDLRHIPNVAATINVVHLNTSNAEVTVAASLVDADDRSLWKVTYTQAQTAIMANSNLRLEIDTLGDTTVIYVAVLKNVLKRQILSGDC